MQSLKVWFIGLICLVSSCMGCGGDLPPVENLPKVSDQAAAKLEDTILLARKGLMPVFVGAGEFCDRFPGEECGRLADVAVALDETLKFADQVVSDYKAGRASFNSAANAVNAALKECENFAELVAQAHKHYL